MSANFSKNKNLTYFVVFLLIYIENSILQLERITSF